MEKSSKKQPSDEEAALKKKTPTEEQPIKKQKQTRAKGEIPNYLKTTQNQSNRVKEQSEPDNRNWDKDLRDGKITERSENGKRRSNSLKKNESLAEPEKKEAKKTDEKHDTKSENNDTKSENYGTKFENNDTKSENYGDKPKSYEENKELTNNDENNQGAKSLGETEKTLDKLHASESNNDIMVNGEDSSSGKKRSILKKNSPDREDSEKSSGRSKTRSCSFAEESETLYYLSLIHI